MLKKIVVYYNKTISKRKIKNLIKRITSGESIELISFGCGICSYEYYKSKHFEST